MTKFGILRNIISLTYIEQSLSCQMSPYLQGRSVEEVVESEF